MTLDSLRAFCAVVEAGSFREAAERVYRTQPAVSQQIKALERELGHMLLDRKTGKPTPAGAVLYRRARGLLLDAENLAKELGEFDEGVGQDLRVGTSDTNALYFLPPYVRAFAKAMPGTRLVVLSRPSDLVADEVERGDVDLGIVTLPLERTGLETRALYTQRLVLVVPRKHPLAKLKRAGLQKLKDENFALLDRGTRTGRLLYGFFAEKDFEPRVVLDSGSFEVIKRYVGEGVGVSFLPEMVVTADDRRRLATVRVPGVPKASIGAVWRRGAYQTKAVRTFLELLGAGGERE